MGFYDYNLLVFVAAIAAVGYYQYKRDVASSHSREVDGEAGKEAVMAARAVNWQFKKRFLPVYLLVNGADWLQGPYIYTMYKDQHNLPEETVAHLFTTGFLAAAISASFVGSLADKHGRRYACLAFCVTYSLSCLAILFDSILVLFAGRILGGISTTLMYSVFESWMVTEYHRQHLDGAGGSLSDIFGIMTTLNGLVAITSGLFAEAITDVAKTQSAPFMTAVACLIMAFWFISKYWNENYGDSAEKGPMTIPGEKPLNGFQYVMADKRLWALCLTSCCFEGSMYLWIFFKFPALRLSHQEGGYTTGLPYGMIFAVLMCAMMLGSMFFTYQSAVKSGFLYVSSSTLLMITLTVAALCFILPVIIRDESITFWCFCLFEICCGVYFPSMAHLKEKIIEDGVRAKIYGIMRIPLNIFVVVGLMLTQEGLRHRENVFIVCSGALISAAMALGVLIAE